MKVHLKDRVRQAQDYPDSPHVQNAILTGTLSACGICGVPSYNLTKAVDQVTCKACLKTLEQETKTMNETQQPNLVRLPSGDYVDPTQVVYVKLESAVTPKTIVKLRKGGKVTTYGDKREEIVKALKGVV